MLVFVFGLGAIAFVVSYAASDNDAKGYYWCVDQVGAIYRKYNKEKIAQAASLCTKYTGKEAKLVEKLLMKYRR